MMIRKFTRELAALGLPPSPGLNINLAPVTEGDLALVRG
jgi:hypothetical protein